jgi:polyisoprenyl-phosphate glycosyltransferase
MAKLSVVIPVYYNEGSLPVLFAELIRIEGELKKRNVELEVIFIDDGSGDGSLRELLQIKNQRDDIKIIKLSRNFGAVHASKTGFRFVTGDCFTILAADMQDPPRLLIDMVDEWQKGFKYVVCARTDRNDPAVSKLFASMYYFLLRRFVSPDYPKGGYDMALMDKSILPYMVQSGKNIYTPLFVYWLGFEPRIISYKREKRVYGRSRWTFGKKLTASLDALLGFSIVPIRFMSAAGVFVSGASFAYGVWITINGILGKTGVAGFATTIALIAFLLGLIIIMLGVIGEYIWRIFDEVNKRPETVIDEVY